MPPYCTKHEQYFVKFRDGIGWHCTQCEEIYGLQSGAPLQPGATQPEHDGVAHETKPIESMWPIDLTLCSLCRKDLLTTKHRWGFIGKVDCPYHPLAYTQIELNDRLERMARLVVQEASKVPSYQVEYLKGQTGEPAASLRSILQNVEIQIRSLLTESKLQQLREAVERGTGI